MALQTKTKIESIEVGEDGKIVVRKKDFHLTTSGKELLIGYHTHVVDCDCDLSSRDPEHWWCCDEVREIAREYFN